jgi:hypothetical protein
MSFRFIYHTNRYIDKLVEISWRESSSHSNEIVFTRTIEEVDTTKVIDDKLDSVEQYEDNIILNLSQEGRAQTFEESQAIRGNKVVIAVDTGLVHLGGIRLRRDSGVSVMYAEELNSTKSSGSLQRTDRQGILGQKPSDFQLFL